MNKYSVYKHTTPSGKVYIGITCRNPKTRWGYGSGYRTQVFNRAIEKYGWKNIKHEIVFSGLTEEEASAKERELIAEYDSCNPEHGYNKNYGGTFGNKVTEEGLLKIAKTKEKAVVQYTTDGRIINRFRSAKEAAEKTGTSRQHISEVCKGHKQLKTTNGYVWRYEGDPFTPIVREHWGKPWRKVAQYSKDGKYIKTYESIGEARRETGARHIRRVLNGENETSGGFVWKEVT